MFLPAVKRGKIRQSLLRERQRRTGGFELWAQSTCNLVFYSSPFSPPLPFQPLLLFQPLPPPINTKSHKKTPFCVSAVLILAKEFVPRAILLYCLVLKGQSSKFLTFSFVQQLNPRGPLRLKSFQFWLSFHKLIILLYLPSL